MTSLSDKKYPKPFCLVAGGVGVTLQTEKLIRTDLNLGFVRSLQTVGGEEGFFGVPDKYIQGVNACPMRLVISWFNGPVRRVISGFNGAVRVLIADLIVQCIE